MALWDIVTNLGKASFDVLGTTDFWAGAAGAAAPAILGAMGMGGGGAGIAYKGAVSSASQEAAVVLQTLNTEIKQSQAALKGAHKHIKVQKDPMPKVDYNSLISRGDRNAFNVLRKKSQEAFTVYKRTRT